MNESPSNPSVTPAAPVHFPGRPVRVTLPGDAAPSGRGLGTSPFPCPAGMTAQQFFTQQLVVVAGDLQATIEQIETACRVWKGRCPGEEFPPLASGVLKAARERLDQAIKSAEGW